MGNAPSLRRRRVRPDDAALLYTKSSGLYSSCAWDEKYVGRLILRGDLAPRHPGRDDRSDAAPEECPICMLNYPALNSTRCCSARLCTECYLQIRPPRHSKEPCPFCKHRRLDATFRGARDAEELAREAADEQRATAAMRRAQAAAAATAAAPADAAAADADLERDAGPLNALRSTHSEGAFSSSAASAAAQAGNSAASASSESEVLDEERPSVDVATMRRFPFLEDEFPGVQLSAVSESGDGPTVFTPICGVEDGEASGRDEGGGRIRTAGYAGPVVCRFSDEFSEAIRRSLLEQ